MRLNNLKSTAKDNKNAFLGVSWVGKHLFQVNIRNTRTTSMEVPEVFLLLILNRYLFFQSFQ